MKRGIFQGDALVPLWFRLGLKSMRMFTRHQRNKLKLLMLHGPPENIHQQRETSINTTPEHR